MNHQVHHFIARTQLNLSAAFPSFPLFPLSIFFPLSLSKYSVLLPSLCYCFLPSDSLRRYLYIVVLDHSYYLSLFILCLFFRSSESRERAYDHSPYGHHERSGTFDRGRHYNADYYRDRSLFATAGPGSSAIGGTFEASDPHFDSRIRDPFALTNSARRDLYRDDRGRHIDRTYHHRRSRSSHSSQSRHPSPQRNTGQTSKTPHSPKRAPLSPERGTRSHSRSRSSSSDSVSSTSSTGSGRCGDYY